MHPATIDDLKKELQKLPPKKVLDLTLRLARFKKENKELLTYLLFESHDEAGYIQTLKIDMDEQFGEIDPSPVAVAKKQYRKILRGINRQIKYVGSKAAAIELLLYYCLKLKNQDTALHPKLQTIFSQQLAKAEKNLPLIEEDLQFDYRQQIDSLKGDDIIVKTTKKRWWKGF